MDKGTRPGGLEIIPGRCEVKDDSAMFIPRKQSNKECGK
jgi:hypothetical protein